MNNFIENNKRVVVHCHAGISRSATAVIAYLMKTSKMTLNQAHEFVQAKRHIICPNFSFMGQLKSYQDDLEVEVLGKNFLMVKATPENQQQQQQQQQQQLVINDLKAEDNKTRKPHYRLNVFSKLELNRDHYHDSGVDTSESSNESPLGSPKNKIQRIEYQDNISIKKNTNNTFPMQI